MEINIKVPIPLRIRATPKTTQGINSHQRLLLLSARYPRRCNIQTEGGIKPPTYRVKRLTGHQSLNLIEQIGLQNIKPSTLMSMHGLSNQQL
ncbi:hypothetical protein MTR_8g088545 [Medicago truncatula]|uniref:Uncharacterized protein n=1 Tax=Medicago truncatula TaxID=3880 RepID=A0A072U4F0_MEDTR|nr:hypothetical protein MTR_8g088545 [Medicago truncatula]